MAKNFLDKAGLQKAFEIVKENCVTKSGTSTVTGSLGFSGAGTIDATSVRGWDIMVQTLDGEVVGDKTLYFV